MSDEYIWVVTDDVAPTRKGGTWRDEVDPDRSFEPAPKGVKLKVDELQAKMTEFLQVVCHIFKQAERQAKPESGLKLTEVELSVEISGEGEIKLVAGAKAAAAGAIKLKFARPDSKET